MGATSISVYRVRSNEFVVLKEVEVDRNFECVRAISTELHFTKIEEIAFNRDFHRMQIIFLDNVLNEPRARVKEGIYNSYYIFRKRGVNLSFLLASIVHVYVCPIFPPQYNIIQIM